MTAEPRVDQRDYEIKTLAHWLALVPDLEDVTVIVTCYGRPVRTIVLEADAARPVTRSLSVPPCPSLVAG